MKYVDRIREYSIYYDDDRLYVEDKDGDGFAAVFDVPPNADAENPVEWLREQFDGAEGWSDMHMRIKRTKGEVTDDRIPPGQAVSRRARKGDSNQPVSAPASEPGPPDWANPGLGNRSNR